MQVTEENDQNRDYSLILVDEPHAKSYPCAKEGGRNKNQNQ